MKSLWAIWNCEDERGSRTMLFEVEYNGVHRTIVKRKDGTLGSLNPKVVQIITEDEAMLLMLEQ